INKAISIVNDGVGTAGIGASAGGNSIVINAGPSDSVHLRGLTLLGLGTGANGILFTAGGNLAIENCVIRSFAFAGLNISPSTSSSFSVSNTIVSNNSGGAGISVQPTGTAVVSGVISNVTANNNGTGIIVVGTGTSSLNVTIVDSVASNNSGLGVGAGGTATTAILLRNVAASNNNIGLSAAATSTLRVGHSVVTGNVTGVFGAGTLDSYGDNDINGNTTDNTGILTVIPPH
ncbi:MAG: hypothetical protein ACREC0_13790, partial [Methylocella sp.]